jgi:ADP-ribosyl-[dinitrogen reductase] hydrolase
MLSVSCPAWLQKLLAANLGDDADTTAAVFGQLAGAFYGAEAIPQGWLAKLGHARIDHRNGG